MAALQNFIDQKTTVFAAWLNQVDNFINTLFQGATSAATALAALGLPSNLFPAAFQNINQQTQLEASLGINPVNYQYTAGDVRRYGAQAGAQSGNQLAVQQAASAAAGGTFYVPAGITFGGLTTVVSFNANTKLQIDGFLQWSSTTPNTGPAGFWGGTLQSAPGLLFNGSNIACRGTGGLIGPATITATGVAAYSANWETAIMCVGVSAAAPFTNITIDGGLTIQGWGTAGVVLQYVKGFKVDGNFITNIAYGGIFYVSCANGIIRRNEIGFISPGTAGNAYGATGTTFPTTATAGSSRADANPLSCGIEVCYNYVHDIPLWTGLDFHGANECEIHHNWIYNCQFGVTFGVLTNSTPNSYAGANNKCNKNKVLAFQQNGSATTIAAFTNGGISITGSSANAGGLQEAFECDGNIIDGYGASSAGNPTAYSIYTHDCSNSTFSKNVIKNAQGHGIFVSSVGINNVYERNIFELMVASTAGSSCIYFTNGGALFSSPVVYGNIHNVAPAGGQVNWPIGCNLVVAAATPISIGIGNSFVSCATPYGNGAGGPLLSANILGRLEPLIPTSAPNTANAGTVYQGSGAPNNANGVNGDVYLRTDTPGTVNQRFYIKSAGSWTGIL